MRNILMAATALVLCSTTITFAQTIGADANNTVNSTTTSGSNSAAYANPNNSNRFNQSGQSIGNGNSASTSSSNLSSNNRSNSNSSAIGTNSSARTGASTSRVGNTSASTGASTSRVGNTSARGGSSNSAVTVNLSNSSGGHGNGGHRGSGNSGNGSSGASGVPNGSGGDPATGTTAQNADPNTLRYAGSYTVRNTPEIIAPSIVGGNACAIGVSGGVALPGFGITGGATWADAQCERRQKAALLYNMGEHDIGVELLCQDDNVRKAALTVGKPCVADRAKMPVAAAAPPPAVLANGTPASCASYTGWVGDIYAKHPECQPHG